MKMMLSLSLLILGSACLAQTNPASAGAQANPALGTAQTTDQLPDNITIGGVTYENVRWQKPTPSSVEIFHKSGIATIPLWKLPSELQQRFGYDPQKATAYSAAEAAARNKQAEINRQAAASQSERLANQNERTAFERDRNSKVVIGRRLVEKEKIRLTKIEGRLRETGVRSQATGQTGCILERDIYESYVVAHRRNALGEGWNVYDQRKAGSEKLLVMTSFPTNSIGDFVQIDAYEVNPVEGLRTFEVAREPTFDEWKKLPVEASPAGAAPKMVTPYGGYRKSE